MTAEFSASEARRLHLLTYRNCRLARRSQVTLSRSSPAARELCPGRCHHQTQPREEAEQWLAILTVIVQQGAISSPSRAPAHCPPRLTHCSR